MKSKKNQDRQVSSRLQLAELTLEKFLLGELSSEEAAQVSSAIASSPELQEQVKQLRQSNQDILKKYPADFIGKKVRDRVNAAKPSSWWSRADLLRKLLVIAPIPVAAVLLVAILPSLRSSTPAQSGQYSEERTKGITTALQIYRQQGGTLEKMANGEPVKPHDLIQLSYSVENRKYGVIVSVDGRKQVTLHWPEKAEVSPLLEPGREVVLPSSFELDESPLFETFVLVTSEKPFSADQIVGAAKAGRMDAGTGRFKIDLPAEGSQGMQQFTITLRK